MAAGPSAGATGKRTYREVTVGARDGGFAVLLDGKPLRTPMGTAVVVLSSALAEAIADEWRGQGAKPDLARVPLTRIAGTALDRVPPRRAELIRALVVYAGTELLCHRADRPADLVARQQQAWQPLLDWLARAYDAPLAVTSGIAACSQPEASLAALERRLAGFDDGRLAALAVAVEATGSLVVGLALVAGRLDAVGAFAAAELDATYQIEKWGEDAEATQRRAGVRADLDAAARFLALYGAT